MNIGGKYGFTNTAYDIRRGHRTRLRFYIGRDPNTISENSCRITGFYEMRFRTAQTKSLCYKREVYNNYVSSV